MCYGWHCNRINRVSAQWFWLFVDHSYSYVLYKILWWKYNEWMKAQRALDFLYRCQTVQFPLKRIYNNMDNYNRIHKILNQFDGSLFWLMTSMLGLTTWFVIWSIIISWQQDAFLARRLKHVYIRGLYRSWGRLSIRCSNKKITKYRIPNRD